jgi:hypothetical protein
MYSHGIAAIALAEAYGMTRDPALYDRVAGAVGFISAARNRRSGGWRYAPRESGDTSVLGWQVMALASARRAGIDVPQQALKSAEAWLEQVEAEPGLYAYRPGEPVTPTMTAEAMFVRQLLGTPPDDPRLRISERFISQQLPDWEEQLNTYNWYYTTLALFHQRSSHWPPWNTALTRELLDHQHTTGARAGSWDPDGAWAAVGGRVYQTAICTLMLEVYYRYLPMYSLDDPVALEPTPPADAIGTIRGRVTDATNDEPIAGATVRLDLPDGPPLVTVTGPDGTYVLHVPQVPSHFALSASSDGYVPVSANVPAAGLPGNRLIRDFRLEPETEAVIAVEAEPEVHHLGNDRWTGRVNSQFQKSAEGRTYVAEFELSSRQLAAATGSASVHLLAKGVQCPHPIYINGHRLDRPLAESPADGSFGEFSQPFDPALLLEGTNTIAIRGTRCRGDVDDFEFVNIQIHLSP